MTKKVEVDEISIKDLTKTIAKSTGTKNIQKAMKKQKDTTKMDLAALRKRLDSLNASYATESVELEEGVIDQVKDIVAKKQAKKIQGTMVDLFTASAISQIYDKVNDANKAKMDKLPITKLADVAMKMMKRESVELDEGAKEKALKALMTRALGGKRAKPGYTSAVANNGDFVVKDGGGRIVGRIKSGSYTDPLKESVELDEISADLAKRALDKRDAQANRLGSAAKRASALKDRSLDKARQRRDREMGTNMRKDAEIKKHTDTAKRAGNVGSNLHHAARKADKKADKTWDYMKKRGMKTESVELEEMVDKMSVSFKEPEKMKQAKKDLMKKGFSVSSAGRLRLKVDGKGKQDVHSTAIDLRNFYGASVVIESVELEENRVDTLAKDFHNRLKKVSNSDRNQNRERYATLAKAKSQGLSPIEMKQLDGKMNAIMNKMDGLTNESVESVNEISAKKYHAALRGREYKRDRARNSAAANQFVGKDAEAQADMAKSKDHDRKLKKMKQMGINRTARNLGEKAPKIDDAKYAAHMARHDKPKKMTSTQKSLANIRRRAETKLNELDQDTLRSYHGKAGAQLNKLRDKVGKGQATSADLKKGQNRVQGLNRSASKME